MLVAQLETVASIAAAISCWADGVHLAGVALPAAGRSPQPISPAKSLFAPVSVEQALLASRPELSSLILFSSRFCYQTSATRTAAVSTMSKTRASTSFL